ncbi:MULTISPECIES: TetR/AcrR family transcriptional regulator [Tatumella]|uniref:TetR/AcrR family transcriptional regulator n=1 Tax=Tatumella punctata TaxID=399969 RepID=A0ABW1VLX5_9GAMM|nr:MULTISPECIES: TetR/AcrR family transcriptional regulator [unclassified Tatumella]MBS0855132.1 TetR/AcrR family transcriptional regulator [Tatumella sp. JGM16]MBS0876162.1 TetR/AcrR family transcriptional regulator [Tatumella sp. JGM82]MBS0889210.1 TetR/AcrR family transcriptional regulator [Tatumella sp. JGM94]MBS0892748.1 TetR/AcrR family transcriptional regulator [Tatumella sp. JGM130]MBS0901092.1 TetR/AcrR family transcriptional regulator [Tatumella sp. JGM100]
MNISPSVNENRQRVLQVAKEIITRKGFSAVGLNEILTAAGIPKGSFYYYFSSKEEFGSAMLEDYFCGYMAEMDRLITTGTCAADTLMRYWQGWLETDNQQVPKGHKCLAVKLGAEVSDLSDRMRAVLNQGTGQIIGRLATLIDQLAAQDNFQIPPEGSEAFARNLYQLWLGASLLGKISGERLSLEAAMILTKRLLGL